MDFPAVLPRELPGHTGRAVAYYCAAAYMKMANVDYFGFRSRRDTRRIEPRPQNDHRAGATSAAVQFFPPMGKVLQRSERSPFRRR